METQQKTMQTNETLVMTRVLNAPIEKVFQAWTDPKMISVWFLPNERWVSCVAEMDQKVGGGYSIEIVHQDSDVVRIEGTVEAYDPYSLVAISWFSNMEPEGAKPSLVTISLKEAANGTELTLTHSKLFSAEQKEQVNAGWKGCLDNIEKLIC